jgi:putative spermidine/putrescine transport system substrate-binding protein
MKRFRGVLAAVMVIGLGTAACGGGGGSGGAIDKVGAGEGALSIVAWAGYVERGDTKGVDWVTQFETDTKCKVSVKVAGTSDEMVQLMTGSSSFDLVTASGDASLRLIRGGTVQPVNTSLVPNYKNVDSRLKNAPWYTVDKKQYGVPYQWGANVLMYNTKTFPQAPTSWNVVFEKMNLPDGKSNEGRVEAYDGPIYLADAALYLKTTQPDLGIGDPYALTKPQFDAAVALLKAQRPLVTRYWHDTTVQTEDFQNEGVVASGSWPYQVNTLVAAKAPVASTVPKEGATGWADTTMLHKNAKHPNCAYKWMNWSLTPKVQGDVAAWFGSVPVVPAACNGNESLGPDGCKTNGIDNFGKIAFWKTPEANCFGKGTCVPYSQWVKAYNEVKNS